MFTNINRFPPGIFRDRVKYHRIICYVCVFKISKGGICTYVDADVDTSIFNLDFYSFIWGFMDQVQNINPILPKTVVYLYPFGIG